MIPAATGRFVFFLYLDFPITFDLAVMAPSRQETLGEAVYFNLATISAYAEIKAAHLDIAAACWGQGVDFFPLGS